jgi:hypothetical protein
MPPWDEGIRGLITKSVVIQEGEVTVLDFDESRQISVSGIVYHGDQPLARAQLYFTREFSLSDFQVAESDLDGHYEVGLEEPGRYRVLVQTGPPQSGGGASTEIIVPDQEYVIQDIHLGGDGIRGRVSDSAGRPLKDAVVSAVRDGAPPEESGFLVASTDTDGRYAIQGLREGSYRVTATAAGFRIGVAYPVTIEVGSSHSDIDFSLDGGDTFRGVVVDPFDRGLGGAAVVAAPSGSVSSWGAATAETDVNGTFQLTAPTDGPIDVTALARGWAPARVMGVLPSVGDDAPPLILRAGRGGRLRIQVVGEDGAPRSGVSLSIRAVPPFLGSELVELLGPPAPTDASGSSFLDNLLPWTYEIHAPGHSVAPIRQAVQEGAESLAVIQLP